jgi:uncharacterized protein YkwD
VLHRSLHPAVAALLSVVVLALAAPATATALGDCAPADAWPAAQPAMAAAVVTLVNVHRAALGLAPLQVSPTLTAAATWKARHMAALGYFDHDDPAPPVARTVAQRLSACGYPGRTWGENIAMGFTTPDAVLAGWLASPGHRANLEDPAFRAIGVGVAGLYWAQDFGGTADAPHAVAPANAAGGAPQASTPVAVAPTAATPPALPRSSVRRVRVRVGCARHARGRVACRVHAPSGTAVRVVLLGGGYAYDPAAGRTHGERRVAMIVH